MNQAKMNDIHRENRGQDGWWQQDKWTVVSACVNLIVILVIGAVYQMLALPLNKWENHRTVKEFDNALALKKFVFQIS